MASTLYQLIVDFNKSKDALEEIARPILPRYLEEYIHGVKGWNFITLERDYDTFLGVYPAGQTPDWYFVFQNQYEDGTTWIDISIIDDFDGWLEKRKRQHIKDLEQSLKSQNERLEKDNIAILDFEKKIKELEDQLKS